VYGKPARIGAMKTFLTSDDEKPPYDTLITQWISAFRADQWNGARLRIGLVCDFHGAKKIYRAIDAYGAEESFALHMLLDSLDLIDCGILGHQQFDRIFGLREHCPAPGEAIIVERLG
jgi:hypothetical protein